MGWGMTTRGIEGNPLPAETVAARVTKVSVIMVAVGMPLFSSWIESRTLPDVQPPQSPTPLTTASNFADSFSAKSVGLLDLRTRITLANLYL